MEAGARPILQAKPSWLSLSSAVPFSYSHTLRAKCSVGREGVAALLTRRGAAALGALCIHLRLESDGKVRVS